MGRRERRHVVEAQRLAAIGLVFLAVTSNTTAIGRIARLLTALRRRTASAETPVTVPGADKPRTAAARLVRT